MKYLIYTYHSYKSCAYAEVISPESFADVTKAKENIQKVTGENDENIISGSYFDQNKLRKRNIAAKDLVGITANYNQFTALFK